MFGLSAINTKNIVRNPYKLHEKECNGTIKKTVEGWVLTCTCPHPENYVGLMGSIHWDADH